MFRNTKRGFVTVEASIFLPVFIIAVLTLAYMMKIYAMDENVTHAMCDEGHRLAENAYVTRIAPDFPSRLEQRVREENPGIDEEIVTRFRYLYRTRGVSDLILIENTYVAYVRLPAAFTGPATRTRRVLIRGFTGAETERRGASYTSLEEDEESVTVWVFPRYGERYHDENCPYIKVDARQRTLNSSIRNKYSPCANCRPGDLANGALVYVFPSGGSYHRGTCPSVDRYVVGMEKDEAIERGYTACSKCGGGAG